MIPVALSVCFTAIDFRMILILLVAVVVSQALSAFAFPTHILVRPPLSVFSCYGGNNGLTNTDVVLTYGYERNWPFNTTTLTISSALVSQILYNLSYPDHKDGEFLVRKAIYLFEQQEHGEEIVIVYL